MKKVEPIRDRKKIEELKMTLKTNNYRNYLMFLTGLSTGLRISDILKLKVKDVKGEYLELNETKTSKDNKIKISNELRKAIDDYIFNKDDNEYLFKSREGDNKPITKVQAYNILKNAGKQIGLEKIGTHSMRKSLGYHYYKKYGNIEHLRKIFNHSSSDVTLDYIGITREEIDDSIDKLWE